MPGGLVVSGELAEQWAAAYDRYTQAVDMSTNNPEAAWVIADASWLVASLWREIGKVPNLPWWSVAAVNTAAEAFEGQARDWQATAAQVPALGVRRAGRDGQ